MLAIADGDNKGEEYWEDVLIEIKNGVTNGSN
jgi:hypothetical protein